MDSHGKSISLSAPPSTVHPNRCKSRQVRVEHWHSVLFISHSFESCYFVRKTIGKESWKADLMGMQVSPNSASGLARCINNEPDLKLV